MQQSISPSHPVAAVSISVYLALKVFTICRSAHLGHKATSAKLLTKQDLYGSLTAWRGLEVWVICAVPCKGDYQYPMSI